MIEDGEWEKADECLEKVLNADPENARSYVGKLLVEKQVKRIDNLEQSGTPIENSSNYQKALRFGDKELVSELSSLNQKNKLFITEKTYQHALDLMNNLNSVRRARVTGQRRGVYEEKNRSI